MIAKVAALKPVRIESTYLGAHVVPDGRQRAAYVEEVVATLPDALRRGAKWCDVYCDDGAFTVEESTAHPSRCQGGWAWPANPRRTAHPHRRGIVGGGTRVCKCGSPRPRDPTRRGCSRWRRGGRSRRPGRVAVPARSERWSHAATLRDAGVRLAIATDCNPGTAWCESMPYAVQLACLGMGLAADYALWAATVGGAAALRLPDRGQLGVRARAGT